MVFSAGPLCRKQQIQLVPGRHIQRLSSVQGRSGPYHRERRHRERRQPGGRRDGHCGVPRDGAFIFGNVRLLHGQVRAHGPRRPLHHHGDERKQFRQGDPAGEVVPDVRRGGRGRHLVQRHGREHLRTRPRRLDGQRRRRLALSRPPLELQRQPQRFAGRFHRDEGRLQRHDCRRQGEADGERQRGGFAQARHQSPEHRRRHD